MPSKSTQTALSFVEALAKGDTAKCVTQFDATMKAGLPAAKLALVWQQLVMANGAYKSHGQPRTEDVAGHTVVFVPATFGKQTLDLKIAVANDSNKIAGFFVVPHHDGGYKEPSYANSNLYIESPVTVGAGTKWQLDGILTLPSTGKAPYPAILLVHGSGPNDKDESIGPNKPFRDLAHGLASQRIAVLRYNKRTFQHQKELATTLPKNFTVKDESLDDVLAATKALREQKNIDTNNIFILGHSLGGTLVPRMAAQDANLRGLISLAGSNTPLEDAVINQNEYIASLSSQPMNAAQKALIEQAKKVKALTDADTDSTEHVLGATPAYWLDLRRHDPLKEIVAVDKPVLFMQGGRDYQVTADGDFENWKRVAAAANKTNLFEFKLYPNLNHLFIAGQGKATPAEYTDSAGNVDRRVIDDIVQWVKSRTLVDAQQ